VFRRVWGMSCGIGVCADTPSTGKRGRAGRNVDADTKGQAGRD